jgi:thiamine transport system ATP-binding protein
MPADGLELRNVRFDYEDMRMVFDLSVARSEFLAIIGPSGSGKSTLLNLIAGFEQPLSGSVTWEGRDLTGLPPADRPLSILFQEHNLFSHLDVWTNVALGMSASLRLSDRQSAAVSDALDQVGLAGFGNRLPDELSGGERQRVGLARMLVRNRPLMLLDEPFAALGPQLKRDMLALIAELRERHGFTILLVTHDPDDARAAASHTALVHAGRIILKADTASFFARRDLPELQAYLGT